MNVQSLLLLQLRACKDLAGVARVLRLRPATLSFILYRIPLAQRYNTFSIPKKGGGSRVILAPTERLKMVQRRLAGVLLQIQYELEFGRARQQCILSHGFKRHLSIVSNAQNHRNKRFVFNVDIEDFFPSLSFGRVRGFFMKDLNFSLDPAAATVVAQIACHNNQLPQGSPCSPVISNLLAHLVDLRLNKIARKYRCTYTRYVDDITFSTNEGDFPAAIAERIAEQPDRWSAGNSLLGGIYLSGFKLRHAKSRMQYRDSRQDTTGLIVNNKINVKSEYYKKTRAMCDRMFVSGKSYDVIDDVLVPVSRDQLRGRLSFVFYIRGIGTGHRKLAKKEQPGYYRLYSQFLDYVTLYDVDRPTIICEGKTDNIYLQCAIDALASKFPKLAEKDSGGLKNVRLFKYSKVSALVQDLSGGTGQLKTLVREYNSRVERFKTTPAHPLILVADADKGSTELFKAVSSIVGTAIGGLDPYYHVCKNLYVVPVPKIKHPETAIEDLFDDTVLNEKVDGKTFDRTNKEKDATKFYGKYVFATRVVSANKNKIDFSRFEAILQAFEDVQLHYAGLLSTGSGPSSVHSVAA